jgi:hypothetical protein
MLNKNSSNSQLVNDALISPCDKNSNSKAMRRRFLRK